MRKLLFVLVILGITLQSCGEKLWTCSNITHKPIKASKKQGNCYY